MGNPFQPEPTGPLSPSVGMSGAAAASVLGPGGLAVGGGGAIRGPGGGSGNNGPAGMGSSGPCIILPPGYESGGCGCPSAPPTGPPNGPTSPSPQTPLIQNPSGAGDNAIVRAASMSNIASSRGISPLAFPTGAGCSSLGGGCVINPATGNLLLQASPPGGDAFTMPPLLAYNSTNAATASEVGNGWTHTFKRQVQIIGGTTPVVVTGNGQSYTYQAANPSSGGNVAPTSDTPNSLLAQAGWRGFTETQPDGTF